MSQGQISAASGGSTNTGAERRWAHRKSCGYRANIIRPGSGTDISCSIVNMSTTGACIKFDDSLSNADNSPHLPAYFTLATCVDRMEIDCTVVWRKGPQIGVRFLSSPRQSPEAEDDS